MLANPEPQGVEEQKIARSEEDIRLGRTVPLEDAKAILRGRRAERRLRERERAAHIKALLEVARLNDVVEALSQQLTEAREALGLCGHRDFPEWVQRKRDAVLAKLSEGQEEKP